MSIRDWFAASSILVAACGPTAGSNGHGGADARGGGLTIDAPACATDVVKAETVPLDLFLMLDQSRSMSQSVSGGGTKWSAVTSAMQTFLGQPGLDGVSIGLQYFGLSSSGGLNDSCTASDYATAAVEISPLPGAATSLNASLAAHSPTSQTPTSAALQGAIDHVSTWAQAHSGDGLAVIFATDGEPSECDTNLTNIDAIAASGMAMTPKIPTFVLGVGSSLSNLNGIAAAGGTQQAFLVDTGGNVNQQFLAAMNAIRHTALGCTYTLPTSTNGPLDYNAVNIVYQPGGGGPPQTLPYVMSKANCPANGNGWYYDNPAAPTKIVLCDSSCAGISVDMTGSVNITLGCSTVIL